MLFLTIPRAASYLENGLYNNTACGRCMSNGFIVKRSPRCKVGRPHVPDRKPHFVAVFAYLLDALLVEISRPHKGVMIVSNVVRSL